VLCTRARRGSRSKQPAARPHSTRESQPLNYQNLPFTPFYLPLKVGVGLELGAGLDADTAHGDGLARLAGDLDIDRVDTEASRVLEEVVVLALSLLPGAAAVGADLELGDGLVGVDDLDGEPVLRGALLVVQVQGGSDAAADELVRRLDDAIGAADGGEGVGEEIEVALLALGALVDDLEELAFELLVIGVVLLTMALMVPVGPVTSMQAPQEAALFQTAPEKAVP
jgi:hypothetical protein